MAGLTMSWTQLAVAWGADGHAVVATLAQFRLHQSARLEVQRLLAAEPGATLVSVASWADEVRSPTTSRWHYVNFAPGDCRYDPYLNCQGGQCVVAAIERQTLVLRSPGSDPDRLKALKYLVHFVGDVHQPLHAGYADDRGGNQFQVRWQGHGSNLHSLWDTGLIQSRPGGAEGALNELLPQGRKAAAQPATPDASGPRHWAEASCQIAQSDGFYPTSHKPGSGYAIQMDALLLRQLDAAGWRLADLLNDALTSER